MEIGIVGSGISAVSSYLALRECNPNFEITFIDPGKRFNVELKKNTRAAAQKSKFGSEYMYETTGSNIVFHSPTNYSMANGGLSSVWGAGLRIWPEKSLQQLRFDVDAIYSSAARLLMHLPHSGSAESIGIPSSAQVKDEDYPQGSEPLFRITQSNQQENPSMLRPSLAIATSGIKSCRGCGQCLTGCPYGSIFDAGDFIDNLVMENKAKRLYGVVSKVKQIDNHVDVQVIQNDLTVTSSFDLILLCAGAVGTPSILQKSNLLPNKIEVLDSQAFYFVALKTPFSKQHKLKFALSEVGYYKKDESINIYASLYESNNEVRKKIAYKISQVIHLPIRNLPSIIDRFLVLGIGFLDSQSSGKIIIQSDEIGAVHIRNATNKKTKQAVKRALRQIAKDFNSRKLRIVPRVTLIPEVGLGFHSGGAAPLDSEHVTSLGTLRKANRIRIADTTLLPFLEPGPHTFTSMALNHGLLSSAKL